MLKDKLKIIAIMLTIILAVSVPFSFADDEVANEVENAEVVTENTDEEAENVIVSEENGETEETNDLEESSDETFKKQDVYLTGKDVKIDYVVDGNVFVMAENVTVSSQIGGDLFVMAKNITVTEEGYVFSNLFSLSDNLNINGVVYDVYACANKVNIEGYVYRDLKANCDTLEIFGTVGRNAFVNANKISFEKSNEEENSFGTIGGDFVYSSKSEITVPEDVVSGEVKYSKDISVKGTETTFIDYVIKILSFLALVAVIWLLALWLAPRFFENTEKLVTKRILPVIGYGVLGTVLVPIIAILLVCLGVTSSIGGVLIILYFALLFMSTSIFLVSVNNVICTKLNKTKKISVFVMLMVLSAIFWFITLIPYLGTIVKFVCVVLGIGIVVANALPHKEKNV